MRRSRILRIVESVDRFPWDGSGVVAFVCGHAEPKDGRTIMRLSRGLTNVSTCAQCTEAYVAGPNPERYRIGRRTILWRGGRA